MLNMKRLLIFIISLVIISCKQPVEGKPAQTRNSDTILVKDFRDFKVLDSKFINNEDLWKPFKKDMVDFSEAIYMNLKPLVIEQDIPTLQKNIQEGKLSYESLVKFYLYRIKEFDRNNELSLNAIIALNPNIIIEAKQKDRELFNRKLKHPIFGMPILLKDNINVLGMPTTAGAVALKGNNANDAYITKQLKSHGALILGKANLSEWAYFFCGDCPSGYSAIGGQTLNPYGRRIMDTGGSSSGSGVAVAANFCVAAVGSETSGSILSPSSQNSIVGLKPTIGLLSRSGIVPISSTLDTPGPMAILLEAMLGFDEADNKSMNPNSDAKAYYDFEDSDLKGRRLGAFKRLFEDTLYVNAIKALKAQGVVIVKIEEEDIELPHFVRLLNLDMKKDLTIYLSEFSDESLKISSVQDVITFNNLDSLKRAPYGQKLFKGIVTDVATEEEFKAIKDTLKRNGKAYFDNPMKTQKLDGFLSINNYHAGFAAVAEYPAITVPMGYSNNGEPKGLTFISKPLTENQILNWAYFFEKASKMRKPPINYN